jgi:uncharacterized sulfatase
MRLNIPSNHRYGISVIAILLVINTVLRVAFYLYNREGASVLPFQEVLMGFWVGIRFDLATIFLFNGLILLFLVLPLALNQRRSTYKALNFMLLVVNIPILLVNFIDMVYYGFAEKRMTHELFTTRSDYHSFKPDMLMEWWWVFLIFFSLIYVFYRALNYLTNWQVSADESENYRASTKDWAITFLFFLMIWGGMRGGIREPISIDTAFVGEDTFTGNLALNSAFTVANTLDWGGDEPVDLIQPQIAIPTMQEMVRNPFDGEFTSKVYPFLRQSHFEGPENRYNVVVLIIESLNANKVGCLTGMPLEKSLTPNLDTLVRHGRIFGNYYSNGIRSVEAVPAVLNSMPEIFQRPTIWSHYSDNTHFGIGQMLAERGYHRSFFCGAHNGTMGFDSYSQRCDIDHYFGMDEYPYADRDFNGYWGCHDGPFLQWMADRQSGFAEPFLSVFFSISNHHPFVLSEDMASDIAQMDLSPMEKTTRYTDRVLGEYFRKVSKEPWFNRTIFVVTGDHCFHEFPNPRRTILDNFRVPLLLLGPGIQPGIDNKIGNHVSILPTLIDLLKLDTWHASSGLSLLDSVRPAFAINSLMGVTTLVMDTVAYSTNFQTQLPSLILRDGKWFNEKHVGPLPAHVKMAMDLKLRSLYQCLQHARVNNRFHAPLKGVVANAN